VDDRGKALAKSRIELRPLAVWLWDALDVSPIRSRNALAKAAGYDKSIVYAAFEGQRLIELVQARDLAEALGADPAELDDLWRAARNALSTSVSASQPAEGATGNEGDDRAIDRSRRRRNLVVAATVMTVAVAGTLGVYLTRASGNSAIMARGDIALIREDGTPRLIFPIASGGIAYCTRPDDDWSRPWAALMADSRWPVISHASIFFSGFHGFEILGVNSGILTFGYRDNTYHWHDPKPALDDRSDNPIQGVSGRPGFFQYWPNSSGDPQFFALVPVEIGGLDIYKRDGISQQWHMLGTIAMQLGRIDSVSLTYLQGQQINVILRVGPRLYEITRDDSGLPGQIAAGWSEPHALSIEGGKRIGATGDPYITYSDVIGELKGNTFWLAVPVRHGLALLSTQNKVSAPWSLESVPIRQQPNSVALMEGYAGGQPNLEIAYREGTNLYSVWRPDGRTWKGPEKIRC